MAKTYTVDRTVPNVYLDNGGNPINGYKVYFTIVEFSEQHTFDVPTIDPAHIETRIDELIEQRQQLAALGG